jgi:hypothetical protein
MLHFDNFFAVAAAIPEQGCNDATMQPNPLFKTIRIYTKKKEARREQRKKKGV